METKPVCKLNQPDAACEAVCECVWVCGRGTTRLHCQLRQRAEGAIEVEVLRNNRLYGSYTFVETMSARSFADRLRNTFEGNGWVPTSA